MDAGGRETVLLADCSVRASTRVGASRPRGRPSLARDVCPAGLFPGSARPGTRPGTGPEAPRTLRSIITHWPGAGWPVPSEAQAAWLGPGLEGRAAG